MESLQQIQENLAQYDVVNTNFPYGLASYVAFFFCFLFIVFLRY